MLLNLRLWDKYYYNKINGTSRRDCGRQDQNQWGRQDNTSSFILNNSGYVK